jgi:hypothetical protein
MKLLYSIVIFGLNVFVVFLGEGGACGQRGNFSMEEQVGKFSLRRFPASLHMFCKLPFSRVEPLMTDI